MSEALQGRLDIEGRGGAIKQVDAIELMRELPDNHVDLLLTDIPYARVNKTSNGFVFLIKKRQTKKPLIYSVLLLKHLE